MQSLADLLGHKIDVRSRLGAGSVFTIEVPLGRAETTNLAAQGHAEKTEGTPARGTILIVDNDPEVLDMLRLLFEDQGQRTIVAADGHQALGLVKRSTMPDLVIADYNLPNGITGLEIIARLQARLQRPIPAIILTGDISTESLRDIAGHGCVHLNKPVRAKDLTRLAQRLLAKPATAADTVEQLPLRPGTRRSSTVFVVDDDPVVGEAISDLLQENGYSVELFTDAAAFLEAYRPGGHGCLLVDALMPGMSGVALIERLKSDGHDLPAIVITGSGAVPMAVQAMKAGAVDFIEKPVGHQDLLASTTRARSDARYSSAVQIAGNRGDKRCESH